MQLPDGETWAVIDRLLADVLECAPDAREARLASVCEGDTTLMAQLRALLRHESESSAIDSIARSRVLLDALTDISGLGPGDCVGGWQLEARIATGGMSEVFQARRHAGGVVQHAALKLLAAGFNDASLRLRFQRECRILAVLADARIARYYDSGIAEDGRPWLAMELVAGEAIDLHVERKGMSLRDRVALFCDLLGAVAHAHRHLVVHRDLKPANVLVTEDGQLKLIDFGIARAFDEHAGESDAAQTRLLTFDYASPEQLQGRPIGTTSDVYQLGLVLYLLIAKRHPFATRKMDRTEQLKAVLDADPEPPSRVMRRAGDRNAPRARGDLDAIILKALEKSPDRRYASADLLAADLMAWRTDRPVRARGAGVIERARKFVRRHRTAVSVGIVLAVVGGGLGGAWLSQVLRANDAAQASEAVLAVLQQALTAGSYGQQPQPPETVSALLDRTEQQADKVLANQPAVRARTLRLIGDARLGRGEYRKAVDVLHRAHLLAMDLPDGGSLNDGIVDQMTLALHYSGDYAEAMYWSSKRVREVSTTVGKIYAYVPHADLLHSLGRYRDAESAVRTAIDLARHHFGDDHGAVAYARQILALSLRDQGRFEQALVELDQAVRIEHLHDAGQSVGMAIALDSLGQVYLLSGNLPAATQALGEAKAIRDHLFQPGYLSRTWVDHRLALLALAKGHVEQAVTGLSSMVADYHRDLGERSHITALARSDLGWALLAAGRREEAAAQFDRADEVLSHVNAGRHPRRSELMLGRAAMLLSQGDHPGAADLADRAFALRRQDTRDTHPALAAICRVARAAGHACDVQTRAGDALAMRQLDLAWRALALPMDIGSLGEHRKDRVLSRLH